MPGPCLERQLAGFFSDLWPSLCLAFSLLLERLLVFGSVDLSSAGCYVCFFFGRCQLLLVSVVGCVYFFPLGAVFAIPVILGGGQVFDLGCQVTTLFL